MSSRVISPESERLALSDGDWLLVKRRLNAGEQRQILKRGMKVVNGSIEIDTLEGAIAKITTYLLDWSLTDPAGKIIPIRDQPAVVVESALDSLDPDSYGEILKAIEAHETAMKTEREAQKKIPSGPPASAPRSSPTSPSPSDSTGDSTGSERLTLMTTTGSSSS
jgi:hypothetical protein